VPETGTDLPAGTSGPHWLSRAAPGLVLLTWFAQAYMIWSANYPPLVDLPNHMARHYLEARALTGEELPAGYAIVYRVVPNLGGDLVVPLLMLVMAPMAAAKLFLTISACLYWLGPALFIARVGRFRPAALLAGMFWLPFAFSGQFFWGFINYYSGVGLAFLVLTHYLRMADSERLRPAEVAGHSGMVALLFLWHLAPWGLYVVVSGCHALANAWTGYPNRASALRRVLVLAAASVPSWVLLAVYLLSEHRLGASDSNVVWGGWTRKAMMWLSPYRSYDGWVDAAAAGLWLAALAVGFRYRWTRSWLNLVLLALGLLYLLLPLQLGSTSDVDTRLAPAIVICVLAYAGTCPLRRAGPALVLLVACLALKLGGIAWAWEQLDRRLVAQAAVFELLPRGSRVMPLVLLSDVSQSKEFPEQHFLEWTVPFKEAFLPTLLALPDQQPLVIDPSYRVFARRGAAGFEIDEARVRECYDYVWLCNPDNVAVRVPDSFSCVFREASVSLLRVR
jgi:hypothetical protein